MNNYELSVWTHTDEYLATLRTNIEFPGQAYDIRFTQNVNGEESLTFSLPATVYNSELGLFEENELVSYVLNEQKIRLIRDKKIENLEKIYDFVVKSHNEIRDGIARIINIECKSYAIYELARIGYGASFSEETMLDLTTTDKANLQYWIKKILVTTNNFDSEIIDEYSALRTYSSNSYVSYNGYIYQSLQDLNLNHTPDEIVQPGQIGWWILIQGANPTGWSFEVIPSVLYEKNNVSGYTLVDNYTSSISYSLDDIVYLEVTNKSYKSLQNNNLAHNPTEVNSIWWEFYCADRAYKEVTDDFTEKERIIKVEKSNAFNIIQELAEKFNVWAKFVYQYNKAYKVIKRKVIFREEIEQNALYSITYGVNSKSISKNSDSSEIATKIFIENVESEFENSGIMSFSEAPQNLSKENFIYNFDYYETLGIISSAQNNYIKTTLVYNIRNKNIDIKTKQSDLAIKQVAYNKILSEKEFVSFEIAGCKEVRSDLQSKRDQTNDVIKSINYLPYMVKERNGSDFLDLSNIKGIDPSTIVIKDYSDNILSYQVYPDPDCPNFAYGVYISTAAERVKASFNYNTYSYYYDLVILQGIKQESLEIKLSNLTAQCDSQLAIINNLSLEIDKLIKEKQKLISDFEREFYFAIKEANWKDDSYKLRKESFIVSEPIQITSDSVATEGYYLTEDIDNIDFDSIRIWNGDYSSEYFNIADYTLDYGKLNGNKCILIIPTDEGHLKTAAYASIQILYNLKVGGTNTINRSILKSTQLLKVIRTYTIPFPNVLTASISIKTDELSDPLVVNTDYTVLLNYDSVVITFKPTVNAKYLDESYIVSYDTNITSKFFYNDAIEVAIRSSTPNVSYSISAVDLSSLDGFEDFKPEVGQKILITDKELSFNNIYGFLSQITFDLNNPENNELTISNYKTRFEDLFQRIAAATQTLDLKTESIDRMLQMLPPTKIIEPDVLKKSVEENFITLSNSLNNDVRFGPEGITLTDLSITNKTPGQIRLVGNGIFLSNEITNGERVWRTGITPSGINASEITTGTLNTGRIIIWDEANPRFLWNSEGLFAYSTYALTGETNFNKYVQFNSDGLKFNTENESSIISAVTLDWNGFSMNQTVVGGTKLVEFGNLSNGNYGLILRTNDGTESIKIDNAGSLVIRGVPKANANFVLDSNYYVTEINGGIIKSGAIVSNNFGSVTGHYTTAGTIFDLNGGSLKSVNFGIEPDGSAYFKGVISGGSINIPEISPNFTVNSSGYMSAYLANIYAGLKVNGGNMSISCGYFGNQSGVGLRIEGHGYFDDNAWVDQWLKVGQYVRSGYRNSSSGNWNDLDYQNVHYGSLAVYGDIVDNVSVRELKENIVPYNIDYAYEFIKSMPIYSYNFKSDKYIKTPRIGTTIDQLPIDVTLTAFERDGQVFSYSAAGVAFFNIAATKVVQTKLEELEKKVELLEEKVRLLGG